MINRIADLAKQSLPLFIGLILLTATSVLAAAPSVPPEFDALTKKLVKAGFSEKNIRSVYTAPHVAFAPKGVSLFFTISESKLDYSQFTSKKMLKKAKKYLKTHQKALKAAEKKYGVDRHVVVAILLVETRLGTYVGTRRAVNSLSSLAAITEKDVRQKVWDIIPPKKRMSEKKFQKKANKRSKWAFNELKALLRYAEENKLDPADIKGSYAGAIGYPQFMPSNILKLGADGNRDGKIDLFQHEDAIFSVARYLKNSRWKNNLSRKKARRVIKRYNHSTPYANTVLDAAYLMQKK